MGEPWLDARNQGVGFVANMANNIHMDGVVEW